MKLSSLFTIVCAPALVVQGQERVCNDVPADLSECVAREMDLDGMCGDCNQTPPTVTDADAGNECQILEDWYCEWSACCLDCYFQAADVLECQFEEQAWYSGCPDFEVELCPATDPDAAAQPEQLPADTTVTDPPATPEQLPADTTVTEPTETTTTDLAACGTDCCSEALAAFAECTIQNCADFDQRCDPMEDVDTCPELEAVCSAFDTCCGGCGKEIEDILATCALNVCGGVSCTSAETRRILQEETLLESDFIASMLVQKEPKQRRTQASTPFEGCSEAVGSFTECALNSCPPDADLVCDNNMDADTCSDVETACQEFSTCCSGQCGGQIEGIIATCAFGVCTDITCAADATADAPETLPETDPTETEPDTEPTETEPDTEPTETEPAPATDAPDTTDAPSAACTQMPTVAGFAAAGGAWMLAA